MSRLRCWVFDVDGVLIDSEAAVREAYFKAGIVMPEDAWGKKWQEWLPQLLEETGAEDPQDAAQLVRARKSRLYWDELTKSPVLPHALLARDLIVQGAHVYILTGAGYDGVRAVLQRCGLTGGPRGVFANQNKEEKGETLASLRTVYSDGVYVDDQDGVTIPEGWLLWKL